MCTQKEFGFHKENFTCFRMLKKCVKIGEGVFGEVFRTERRNQSLALKVDMLYIFAICTVQ